MQYIVYYNFCFFLYRNLFTNAHGMDFQMKMTQPYTQLCSSLYWQPTDYHWLFA
jgi:hypothetical protein